MSDTVLRQVILDELEREPGIDAADIGAAVADGVVRLTGHVPNYAQKSTVEGVVGRIKSVKGIAENLEVHFRGNADDEIASGAVSSLQWNTTMPDNAVTVHKGWMTLSGTVQCNFQKTAAADAIRGLHSVTGISNLIAIRTGPVVSAADVRKRIENSLKRNAELETHSIGVDVEGSRVTLAGHVRAWPERRPVEDAAWATPAVATVDEGHPAGHCQRTNGTTSRCLIGGRPLVPEPISFVNDPARSHSCLGVIGSTSVCVANRRDRPAKRTHRPRVRTQLHQ